MSVVYTPMLDLPVVICLFVGWLVYVMLGSVDQSYVVQIPTSHVVSVKPVITFFFFSWEGLVLRKQWG